MQRPEVGEGKRGKDPPDHSDPGWKASNDFFLKQSGPTYLGVFPGVVNVQLTEVGCHLVCVPFLYSFLKEGKL